MEATRFVLMLGVVLGLSACTGQSQGVATGTDASAGTEASLPPVATAADAATGPVVTSLVGTTEVSTRFGIVGVFRNEDEGISYLTYNGDTSTLGVDMDFVKLIALVRWPDRDAVMYETDCSGSSCGWPNYGLLELQADAAPQQVSTDGLPFSGGDTDTARNEAMTPVLSAQPDGSVLIGTAGDARTWFTYRPGQLVERSAP